MNIEEEREEYLKYKDREEQEIEREDFDDFEKIADEFNEERRKPFPSKKKLLEKIKRMKNIFE
jgi:hypothetical protein